MPIEQEPVNALEDLKLETLNSSDQDWENLLIAAYGMTELGGSRGSG